MTFFKKHFLKKVILRCIGLCFNYHHLYLLSRLDQPLIQRIPAGLSSTVACLDITHFEKEPGSRVVAQAIVGRFGGRDVGYCHHPPKQSHNRLGKYSRSRPSLIFKADYSYQAKLIFIIKALYFASLS